MVYPPLIAVLAAEFFAKMFKDGRLLRRAFRECVEDGSGVKSAGSSQNNHLESSPDIKHFSDMSITKSSAHETTCLYSCYQVA